MAADKKEENSAFIRVNLRPINPVEKAFRSAC